MEAHGLKREQGDSAQLEPWLNLHEATGAKQSPNFTKLTFLSFSSLEKAGAGFRDMFLDSVGPSMAKACLDILLLEGDHFGRCGL